MKIDKSIIFFILFVVIVSYFTPILQERIIELWNNQELKELKSTTREINKEIKSFYNYNESYTGKYNLEELKETGGVCWHYSQYAYDRAIEEDMYAKQVTILVNNSKWTNHKFTVISNKAGYCIVDQINYVCFEITD